MKTLIAAAALAGLSLAAPILVTSALADPTGTYSVKGSNPDDKSTYDGTVRITKTGDTFKVVWTVGDDTFTGTAIGDDDILSIGYDAGGKPGVGLFVKQDGKWQGIWTYLGEKKEGKEVWTQ